MSSTLHLKKNDATITIIGGELVSFKSNNEEFIHSKNSPGWNSSDTEMFPIVGPTKLNHFKVHTKEGVAIQDQHGLLRELNYQTVSNTNISAIYEKKYKKNTLIDNSKYPEKSTEEKLHWPYDFSFRKTFTLMGSSLIIDFEFISDEKMPYMLGYHPAFNLSGLGTEILKIKDKVITLNDVLKVGSSAYKISNCNEIVLEKNNSKNLKITTINFNNFMLWTEVNNMLCIEPITQYPSLETQEYSEENMRLSGSNNKFSVTITPF